MTAAPKRRRPKPYMQFTSEVPWTKPPDDAPFMFGYVRVSTDQQSTQRQVDELVAAGVSPLDIFGDQATGAHMHRDGWEDCTRELQAGDILVIHSLDRLSRDLIHTMTALKDLNDRGVTVKVLTMDFDSRTPMGRFIFSMMAAFAQFERELILERTMHGLAKARERGRFGGSVQKYDPAIILATYEKLGSVEKTAKKLKCSEITVKRGLKTMRERKEAQGE
jgi:DNA invertase Pin-like site-specific DNA recombinase